jgi:hypothetical protein
MKKKFRSPGPFSSYPRPYTAYTKMEITVNGFWTFPLELNSLVSVTNTFFHTLTIFFICVAGGVFVVLLCGLALAILVAILEFCWNSKKNAQSDRVCTILPKNPAWGTCNTLNSCSKNVTTKRYIETPALSSRDFIEKPVNENKTNVQDLKVLMDYGTLPVHSGRHLPTFREDHASSIFRAKWSALKIEAARFSETCLNFYPPTRCHNPIKQYIFTITGDTVTTCTFYYHVTAVAVFWDGRGTAICRTVSRVSAKAGVEAVLYALFSRHHIRSCSVRDASYQRGQWVPPTVYTTQ